MTDLGLFVAAVMAAVGWVASSSLWRWRTSRALHELAKISTQRELSAEDLMLQFTPGAPLPARPMSSPSTRRWGASK